MIYCRVCGEYVDIDDIYEPIQYDDFGVPYFVCEQCHDDVVDNFGIED